MKLLNISAFVLLIFMFAIISAHAQSSQQETLAKSTGKLFGVVLDTGNARVPKAKVTIASAGFTLVALSADDGSLQLELPANLYSVTAVRDGFHESDLQLVQIRPNYTTNLQVILKGKHVKEELVPLAPLRTETDVPNITIETKLAQTQENIQRLRSGETLKGFIGGESHDSYVIQANQGQTMSVQISWKQDKDNHAEFFVSEQPDFNGDGRVTFGTVSTNRKKWRGKMPRTGDYYIYVMAHPVANYELQVTVK